jgi:hypothetical protein
MSEDPQSPRVDRWADLLRPSYDYPESVEEAGTGLTGRQRKAAQRRARRDWRVADRSARKEWITAQDRRDPDVTEGRPGIVVVVALLFAGAMVVGGLRSCHDDAVQTVASTTTADASTGNGAAPSPAPSSPRPSAAPTTPSAVAGLSPAEVATAWAQAWLSFSATTGDTEADHLARAEPYMTDELIDWLSNPDPVVQAYLTEGTDIAVAGVEVQPAPPTAPADTDVRRSLQLMVTSSWTAGPDAGLTDSTRYLVTLMRADGGQDWLVSDFAGDTEG